MSSIRIVVKYPQRTSVIEAVENSQENICNILDCSNFKVFHKLPEQIKQKNIVMLVSEEIKEVENFTVFDTTVYGTAVFVKLDGEYYASLSADEVMLVRAWLLFTTGK